MKHIRIKICGITRREDAHAAAALGADALGLVFYAGSKRAVSAAQAREIVRDLPPFVSVTALFVNANAAEVESVLRQVPTDVLQFHGDEPPEFCRRFARPYLKAVRVRSADDVRAAVRDYPDARALLLDAYAENAYGGTGQTFDWQNIPSDLTRPWILAGGLNADNVAAAIAASGAAAVDVSGGVEAAAGVKCARKMADFIAACRSV